MNSIRKIINKESSFNEHFNTADSLLSILGLNVFDPNWCRSFHSKIPFVFFAILSFIAVVFAFFGAFHTYKGSLEDQLSSLLSAFFAFQIAAKIGVLVFKCQNYRKIKILSKQFIREGLHGENFVYQQILLKYQHAASVIFKWMKIIYGQAFIVLTAAPFLNSKAWGFPINCAIPGVSVDSYPGYTINYIFISFLCFLAVIMITGFDYYIILQSLILASRFEYCAIYFNKLGNKISASNLNEKKYILDGLKLHSETMDFFHICRNTMEPIVFIQIFIIILLTCCQMGIFFLNPFNQTILTFCSTITQTLLCCVCGELVATKAFEVSEKLYGSHWYDIKEEQLKKMLVVVLNRSQQPCYFSIGYYAPLSMGTFATIMSVTYRCYNFMRNVF